MTDQRSIPPGTYTVYFSGPCGSGLTIDTQRFASDYAARQQAAIAALAPTLGRRYRIAAPNAVHTAWSGFTAARHDKVYWYESAGTPRVPAAFLRLFATPERAVEAGDGRVTATLADLRFTLHDYAVMVIGAEVTLTLAEAVPLRDYQRIVETIGHVTLVDATQREVAALCKELRQRLTAVAAETDAEADSRLLGYHRVYEFDRRSLDGLAPADLTGLLQFPDRRGLENGCATDGAFCYPGNGNSLIVAEQADQVAAFSPRAVVDYFEYIYAAVLQLDRALYFELERISGTGHRRRALETRLRCLETLKDRAADLAFRINDEVNTLPPLHLGYWQYMLTTWRLPALRRSLAEKVETANDRCRRIEERISLAVRRQTNVAISLLTTLGLISIVVDGVSFFFDSSAFGQAVSRGMTIGGTLLVAAALFLFLLRQR